MARLITLFREEGLGFEFAFTEALRRLRHAGMSEGWHDLLEQYQGAWAESWRDPAALACVVVAIDRLAQEQITA